MDKFVEQKIYKVSELVGQIKSFLESDYGDCRLEGEISGFRRAASGHAYFTLKDDKSQIQAVLFKWSDRFVNFNPEDGLKVIARGQLTLYEARGNFQMVVRSMRQAGAGDLMKRFQELKARLEAEGLFDPARKREIPYLPQRVGVVTSPTGAVWHDIQNVIARRFPEMPILLAPCLVQGAGAADSIAQAIRLHNEAGETDVLIVGRGGGSLEDLWAFNEEAVVRAVAESKIPVISSVGHETDFSLCDFAADLRAPTPSAAAELAVPESEALEARLEESAQRMAQALRARSEGLARRLEGAQRALASRTPWKEASQRLDISEHELIQPMRGHIHGALGRLHRIESRLRQAEPREALGQRRRRLDRLENRFNERMASRLAAQRHRLEILGVQLRDLGPTPVLERGYAMVQTDNGRLVKDAGALGADQAVQLIFAKGSRRARVE